MVGDGGTITDQTPARGAIIPGKPGHPLRRERKSPRPSTGAPRVGQDLGERQQTATNRGAPCGPAPRRQLSSSSTVAVSQSIDAGTMVDPGTVITVQLVDTDIQDYANRHPFGDRR